MNSQGHKLFPWHEKQKLKNTPQKKSLRVMLKPIFRKLIDVNFICNMDEASFTEKKILKYNT